MPGLKPISVHTLLHRSEGLLLPKKPLLRTLSRAEEHRTRCDYFTTFHNRANGPVLFRLWNTHKLERLRCYKILSGISCIGAALIFAEIEFHDLPVSAEKSMSLSVIQKVFGVIADSKK